jgi:hypothetical protein
MTIQDIFDRLSEEESKLFYSLIRDPDNKELQERHTAAKIALEAFAKVSGCHN